MKRFYHENSRPGKSLFAGVLFFLIVFFAFSSGISNVSDETQENQTETLKLAISRSITHCYATEGHYPESLAYIQEHYGITYDTNKYFVDYQVLGENIFPDITIIEK